MSPSGDSALCQRVRGSFRGWPAFLIGSRGTSTAGDSHDDSNGQKNYPEVLVEGAHRISPARSELLPARYGPTVAMSNHA
jgi:hypothetical protein